MVILFRLLSVFFCTVKSLFQLAGKAKTKIAYHHGPGK
jgi:hypothetical protein